MAGGCFRSSLLTGRWLRLFAEIRVFGLSVATTPPPMGDCAINSSPLSFVGTSNGVAGEIHRGMILA